MEEVNHLVGMGKVSKINENLLLTKVIVHVTLIHFTNKYFCLLKK